MLLEVAPHLHSTYFLFGHIWTMAYSQLGYSYSTTPQVRVVYCFVFDVIDEDLS